MIKEIEHFIPDNLCDKIIDTFKNQLVTAETFNPLKEGGKTKMKVSDIRVASNYFFDEQSFPEILPLKNQISKHIEIKINCVKKIPLNKNGKFQAIISKLKKENEKEKYLDTQSNGRYV